MIIQSFNMENIRFSEASGYSEMCLEIKVWRG